MGSPGTESVVERRPPGHRTIGSVDGVRASGCDIGHAPGHRSDTGGCWLSGTRVVIFTRARTDYGAVHDTPQENMT